MYVGIDIGGTKTLVAALDDKGVILESFKFPTPKSYDDFLQQLADSVAELTTKNFKAGCVAAPGALDRHRGIVKNFGNLKWQNVPLQKDVEKITRCPMLLENDAKLAGLSEAMLLKKYGRVLYVTISTGIGYALVVDQAIDTAVGDPGGRAMMLEHRGKLVPWETFASGSAIVQRYGKRASEINDQATWKQITHDLAPGFLELIAILHPEVIVVGGGVGHYLERFHDPLVAELKRYENPMLTIPPIVEAQRPDEAVVYGCYDLARSVYA
jgi:glucokinase